MIFQKMFASDATPKRHLMAHQMKNLCGFSVFHCVEGAFGASSGGTPKMKNGAPRDELKNWSWSWLGRPLLQEPKRTPHQFQKSLRTALKEWFLNNSRLRLSRSLPSKTRALESCKSHQKVRPNVTRQNREEKTA